MRSKMRIALAASTFIALSSVSSVPAFADDEFLMCREEAIATCSLFFPPGTSQWAGCVEFSIDLCLGNFPAVASSDYRIEEFSEYYVYMF